MTRIHPAIPLLLLVAGSVAAAENAPRPVAPHLDAAINGGEFKEITSVLVSRNGHTLYERYWGEGGPTVLNDTRSATKSLTAMLVGAAIADGHIASVSDPAFAAFAEERPFRFSSDVKDAITIRDLLTMSSALDCNDDVWESPGNEEHMYPSKRWTYFVLDMPTRDDYRRDERGYGAFSYCTAGSFILGQVLERAVGESVDAYANRRLFKPLGIEAVQWGRSPSGEVQTGGGTRLTSGALLRLGQLVLNGGRWNDRTLLPRAWIDEMLTAHVRANAENDYGYQWWRADFHCGSESLSGWYMSGNGGNKVVLFEGLELVVVVTARLYGTPGMHQQSTDIVNDHVLASLPECTQQNESSDSQVRVRRYLDSSSGPAAPAADGDALS